MKGAKTSSGATNEEAERTIDVYRRLASHYDWAAQLPYLIGFRDASYRRWAIDALQLRPGDTVVEIGCGTGQNLEQLYEGVGPTGKIVGVDLTGAMLDGARQRVVAAGWRNVELVQRDASCYEFPRGVDGIVSTFALSFSTHCDEVIREGSRALSSGRRWVVLDQKLPRRPFRSLMPLFMPFLRSFAVDEAFLGRRPWQRIREAMEYRLEGVHVEERYFGYVYLATGGRGAEPLPPNKAGEVDALKVD